MEYKDYYKIMELERGASQEEIKRVYRKLARKYHPDVSKEEHAEAKFKELGEAYDVLRDPEKRAKYDRYGQYWKEQEQAGNNPHAGQQSYQHSQHFDEEQAADFQDFLNDIFRERYGQSRSFYDQGNDIHAKLLISLEDSFFGAEKTLQLQTPVVDQRGHVQYHERAVKVKIPKGITDKKQIRLKGQGGKGPHHHAGDLYIEININPHTIYTLQQKDIYLRVPITPWEAALGATIQVPTLAGSVNLKIPKLSQTGKQMRLKGRGLPGNPPGDQYISLEIVIPPVDNAEASKLYEELAKTIHFNPREKLGVDKMTEHKLDPQKEGEAWFYLSMTEVISSFGITRETIIEIIDEGIISVQRDEHNEWCFDDESVRCIRTVLRLQHDLGVNLAGAGLALELLKEIDYLRTALRDR